jgi:hypothetical protein
MNPSCHHRRLFCTLLLWALMPLMALAEDRVRVATFDVDATPPMGFAMAYDPVKRLDELTLRCRGVVILGSGKPIVLCAVDWLGIANEGHDAFRMALAEAAGTEKARVAVHTLHQHDAPGCDFTAEKIITELGVEGYHRFDGTFHRQVIEMAAAAIRRALPDARAVTHYGYGEAAVEKVASQRRIEGPDGRIRAVRYSTTRDLALRDEPEGRIDPLVSLLGFWDGEVPVALLTSYACHPQSYYRRGIPSPDFPGIARFIRGQELNDALHVHFNGAGGDITAGKYNDGSEENRMILANRLADGMREAYQKADRIPLTPQDVGWSSLPVSLPLAPHLDEPDLIEKIKSTPAAGYVSYADQLAWVRRVKGGHQIEITCLSIGATRMLHLPGELLVSYQLAAKAMRPDLQVMMAAYGDYGPAYIAAAADYAKGGYETEPRASNVAPEVEPVLINAMASILEAPDKMMDSSATDEGAKPPGTK